MNRLIFLAAWALFLLPQAKAEDNTLTGMEKDEGWVLLFDGKTAKGWISPKGKAIANTHVQQGALNPHPCEYMLTTEKTFDNFLLSLDYRISGKCNSGVFFRTFPLQPRPGRDVGFNGLELAIDDTKGTGFHDTGAIYDLVRPAKSAALPAGMWNHLLLRCDRNLVEVELNGEKVTRMDLDQWPKKNLRPDGTSHKFDVVYKDHPRHGHIGLQDHGSDCWFKNIKIKPLP
ncbi:MAG: DUF1080 domain-containing protein [Gemmataceae bacterium]|nr:DUF1080 domain-containing protein [Gemmataceae bacterium]